MHDTFGDQNVILRTNRRRNHKKKEETGNMENVVAYISLARRTKIKSCTWMQAQWCYTHTHKK